MAPKGVKEMKQAAEMSPTDGVDTLMVNSAAATVRLAYIDEADRIGSVPLPGTLKGVAKTGVQKLSGKSPEVLIDKMGERLAFERSGVRLYNALILKCQDTAQHNIPVDRLEHFRDEEQAHFQLLTQCMQSLGADPTAETPCADVSGVASMGIMQVLTDPRTTIAQCLNALLTVELSDNAGWELLIKLAEQSEQSELVERFAGALEEEDEHLENVKAWLEESTLAEHEML
jgi:ferritin-like metal-binding protein YciE